MQRRTRSYSKRFKPTKLFLEDVERIIALLSEGKRELTVSDADHTYADIAEWKSNNTEPTHSLELTSTNRYNPDGETRVITLSLSESESSLSASSIALEETGLCSQVEQVLREHRHPLHLLFDPFIAAALPFFLLLSSTSIGSMDHASQPISYHTITTWFLLILMTVICFLASFAADKFRHSTIVPRRRSDAPHYIKRNWDKILTSVVTAIILIGVNAFIPKHSDDQKAQAAPSSQPTTRP